MYLFSGHYVSANGQLFTIIDTPGFGDSDGEDSELIDEMTVALKDSIKTTNGFVILFHGQEDRYNESLQRMLREFAMIFGKKFWDYAIMGFSFWPYDEHSIKRRNQT